MWLSQLTGLADPYWGAISAVVAAAPTVGADLTAALSRVAATVVGLALGLAAVAVSGSGVLVAGVTSSSLSWCFPRSRWTGERDSAPRPR
jgi:uncharacterized membrane protein YgaE (UPF0421/DUF939 family)